MDKIEEVSSPRIGEQYLVKCIKATEWQDKDKALWQPVFGELHHDKEIYLQKMHYHKDWRFVDAAEIKEQEELFDRVYPGFGNDSHLFAPITEETILEGPEYFPMVYQRHFAEPCWKGFEVLNTLYKDAIMTDMICPHKKANLTSCQIIRGVVTCPLHGLRWEVKTGKLIT